VVLLPLVAMVWQLLLFHAVLLYRGITTYEYIIGESKRKAKKREAKVREVAERQRSGAEEKARLRALVEKSKTNPIGSGANEAASLDAAEAGTNGGVEMVIKGNKTNGFSPVQSGESDVEATAGAGTGTVSKSIDASQLKLLPMDPSKSTPASSTAVSSVSAIVEKGDAGEGERGEQAV
jgi:hypothetical protein